MNKLGFLVVTATIVLILAPREVKSLRCWLCSSDAVGSEFCADPFSEEKVTALQKHHSYVECQSQNSQKVRAVCKKLKERINDQIVVRRSCFSEDINDPPNKCANTTREAAPSGVQIISCDTCSTDGCNIAAKKFSPVATIILITVFVAKILLL